MNTVVKAVLLPVKSLLSTTSFLLVLAVFILGTFVFASTYTGQWHWFQRSGALVVGIGAILSTRRLLRIGLDGLLQGRTYFDIANNIHANTTGRKDIESERDLVAAYWGFVVVGFGTIVWAFGDLVECIIAWDMNCTV
jgi:hypothetical protein